MGRAENNPMIFISSDKRDLYFEDVFRVMVAPNLYSIKFRYRNKWIEDVSKVNVGTEIIICSLLGTKDDNKGTKKELIPIRKAKVQAVNSNGLNEDDLVMYYLELEEFVQLTSEVKKIDLDNIPNKVVCTTIEGEKLNIKTCSWEEKVEELFSLQNDCFRNRLMYKIERLETKKICKGWTDVLLKEKNTYLLHNNSDYQLIIKLKKEESLKKAVLNVSADEKSFRNILTTFSLDAPRDTIKNDFYVGALDKDNRYSRITFSSVPKGVKDQKDNKYDFKINVKFSRKKLHYLLFGIFMGVFTTITKYNGIISFSKIVDIWNDKGCLGILNYSLFPLLVGLISGALFYGYDKK